jgi:hypothetical protein
MTSDQVAAFLGLGVLLTVGIALWARAWGRNPFIWGLIALFMTPFGFLFVVVALVLRGPRPSRPDKRPVRPDV